MMIFDQVSVDAGQYLKANISAQVELFEATMGAFPLTES
jgi:hypothetical protein